MVTLTETVAEVTVTPEIIIIILEIIITILVKTIITLKIIILTVLDLIIHGNVIVTDLILTKETITITIVILLTLIEPIIILHETIITIAPDMINIIEIHPIIAIPDLLQETTPILVIDLKVITSEITLTLLEITNTHTAVLLNQDKIIDRDTIVLTQIQDHIFNLLLTMLNLPLIMLTLKLRMIHHLKLT